MDSKPTELLYKKGTKEPSYITQDPTNPDLTIVDNYVDVADNSQSTLLENPGTAIFLTLTLNKPI